MNGGDGGGGDRGGDVAPALLPEDRHEQILASLVLPTWTSGACAQRRPVAVFVAGQPGSGKSGMSALVKAALDQRGGAVLVSSDLYKRMHPQYSELLAEDDRTAGRRVRSTVRRWQAEIEAHVRRGRFDTVVETALADPDEFRAAAGAYRRAGYRIEVAVLATPEPWSQLSVLDRYLSQAEASGAGRYVGWDNHDDCARGLLDTLAVLEAERLADLVTVFARDGSVRHRDELRDGRWRHPPGAVDAVARERSRPWSAAESWAFRRELAAIERRLGGDRVPAERRLAVAAAVERASALAEPQRRSAQVRPGAPGVDYHRLSPDEHRRTFEEQLVPGLLDGGIPQARPVVVYVMGQPGAGKTGISRLVRRALAARRPVLITAEDFKTAHPDYRELLGTHPRGAGAMIRADVKRWQAQAEEYVRLRRGDAVIELAPGGPEVFRASAARFRQAGYRVELVVLAVRAADSRQGTAQRFARATATGHRPVARFTSPSGHDRCYDAVAATVQLAESQRAVDSIVVLRRDAQQLWRNERLPSTALLHPPHAGWALAAERLRPYTPAEATRFLAVQRCLRAALPQYRDDLAQIDALARPLLPARLRPTPVPRSRAHAEAPLVRLAPSAEDHPIS